MNPMRVAYILKMYPRFSETFILNEILELERRGVELDIFSLKKPDDGRFHADLSRVNARVTYVPARPLRQWSSTGSAHREVCRWDPARYSRLLLRSARRRRMGALKRFDQAVYIAPRLRRAGIDHVHAHFASSATSVALYLNRLANVSYSFTAHAKDIFHEQVGQESLRRKLRESRFVVTVSDHNVNVLTALEQEANITRIYNGLDLNRFKRNGTAVIDPPLVLAVGRLVEKKGFRDLIVACDLLRKSGRRFRCMIVGKGELKGELEELVLQLGLGDVVDLPGPLPREALLDLYPKASVFAAPCVVGKDGNRDGLPTVLIEAMALGVPVVATPVTGIPELVMHEKTGLIVPEHDPEALAGAIHRLLTTHRVGVERLSTAARQRVESHFDVRANVGHLHELLRGASA